MNKNPLGTDRLKEQKLRTSTNHACFILNRCIFPIAHEIKMHINIQDKETLLRYVLNLDAMRADYEKTAMEGVENPALKKVAEDVTGREFNRAFKNFPLPNPDIVRNIVDDAMEYVSIAGNSVHDAKALANNYAIKEASIIYATPEDDAKKAELEALCEALNRAFNGQGQSFQQYIFEDDGKFFLNPRIINFKPLIYGK